ncbi:MAG: alpha/beta hydrolase [Phycisphaera sp.]|nr:alpha/beta hydrolase [Phycisphaera sp.]
MHTRRINIYIATLLLSLTVLGGCERRMMGTPLMYCCQPGAADCFETVPQGLRGCGVDVMYVTDRLPVHVDDLPPTQTRYGSGRAYGLAFGDACVSMRNTADDWAAIVSTTVSRGAANSVSLDVSSVRELGRLPNTPSSSDINADAAPPDALAAMQAEIRRRLALTDRKEVFVYVHGVNNSFDDAVMSMAELWHFLGREGVPIAYTWPSRREVSLTGYAYDRESGEFTVYHLKQFIRAVAACAEVKKLHILAHSRGCDVTISALRELFIESRAAGRDPHETYRIGNLVFAAPDLDVDVASQRFGAERMGDAADRITMYVSENDKALGIASWMFSSVKRLGRLGLGDLLGDNAALNLNLPKVDTIDVTAQLDFLGHTYFTNSPAVSSDLVLLLRDNRAPGAAHGRPLKPIAEGYWELPDGYPGNATPTVRTAE